MADFTCVVVIYKVTIQITTILIWFNIK